MVEAAQRVPASAGWLTGTRAQITARRGRNIATVAVARRLLTLVYYGLRDGHIRPPTATRRNDSGGGVIFGSIGRVVAWGYGSRQLAAQPRP